MIVHAFSLLVASTVYVWIVCSKNCPQPSQAYGWTLILVIIFFSMTVNQDAFSLHLSLSNITASSTHELYMNVLEICSSSCFIRLVLAKRQIVKLWEDSRCNESGNISSISKKQRSLIEAVKISLLRKR